MDQLKYTFKQEAGSGVLDLYIYSEVCSDYYTIDENWKYQKVESATSAEYFRKQLDEHKGVTQINLYINSMGGSVLEGYGIYCQLKRYPAQKTAYIDGFACSIASIIACAADQVIAYPNSMMMIHNMADGAFGNATQLREVADALDKIMEGNRQVYIAKSGGKLDESKLTAMLNDETWLTAQDCLAYGLVDEIKTDGGMSGQTAAALLETANGDLKNQLARRMLLIQTARTIHMDTAPLPSQPEPVNAPTPAKEQQASEEKTLAALFSGFGGKPKA